MLFCIDTQMGYAASGGTDVILVRTEIHRNSARSRTYESVAWGYEVRRLRDVIVRHSPDGVLEGRSRRDIGISYVLRYCRAVVFYIV